MEKEDRINELLSKIEVLSNDIEKYRKELHSLKSELIHLKQHGSVTINKPPVIREDKAVVQGFENFIGLKIIHFVGIIVLIIGLTIGVKYAIDINLISPMLRIALTYLAGAALFFTSLKLRKKYELFSLILFSGSMACAYFTTYAAYEYYAILPKLVAGVLMLILTLFTVYNALKYDRQEVAILGFVGAYGIPFFVRGNADNIVALFSYILFINAGILAVSFKKYWLTLTHLAFAATWVIYLSWLVIYSGNTDIDAALIFGFAFFTLFLLNSLGFKIIKGQTLIIQDVFIVVANTVLLYFSLVLICNNMGFLSVENLTILVGIVYLLAALISKRYLPSQPYLSHALFSVSIPLFVAFVALKYTGLPVTIIWVILAIIMFIAGMLFKEKVFRIAAILLFATTLLKLLLVDSSRFNSVEKVIAFILTGTVLLIVSFLYQKFKATIFNDN